MPKIEAFHIYIFIEICVIIHDFSLALRRLFQPCLPPYAKLPPLTFPVIFHFAVTVLNMQYHPFHWTFYKMYEEHSCLNRVSTLPTWDLKSFTANCRLQKLRETVGGCYEATRGTRRACSHREQHSKNNYSWLILPAIPKATRGWAILAQLDGINPLLSRCFSGITHRLSSPFSCCTITACG